MKIIAKSDLNQKYVFAVMLLIIGLMQATLAQPIRQTQNKLDMTLRSAARVNPTTLGMELSIPLGGYAGRAGNDKPLTLEYSSKVWSTWPPDVWFTPIGTPYTDLRPMFGKGSVRGWTTSLQTPQLLFSYDLYGSPHEGQEGQLMTPDNETGLFYIKRVNVIMPDGASHELRQDDNLYFWGTSGGSFDFAGTYLSVDGSKMRLETDSSQTTLYLPDGARMVWNANSTVSIYFDSNGNKMTYAANTKQWTDTLGRVLTNPLWADQTEIGTYQPTEGTQVYQFPGFNGQNQQVELIWAKLSTQQSSLAYMTNKYCLSFLEKNLPSGSTLLFSAIGNQSRACDPYTTPFDPVLLTEVRLQNGSAYKFHYNLYGEVDKIEYPTGGYERFEYGQITPVQSAGDDAYDQFNRGVKKRWVSADGTTASEVLWQYNVTRVNQELPTDYYKIRTTAPDNSYTEQYLFDQDSDLQYPWSFGNIAIGRQYEERIFSTTGQLLERKLTKYTKTGALPGGYAGATRDLRPEKEISITFEPGETYALAQKTETFYDTDGNSDPAYFSSLNPEQTKTYHYVVISTADAQPTTLVGDAEFNRIANYLSNAQIASMSELDYLYSPSYKTRNINGLLAETRIKDASGNVKSRSQFVYDETNYLEAASITNATGWENPQTSVRGLITTSRSWHDVGNNQYIERHMLYDQFGNIRKSWDGRGNYTETQYQDNYTDSINRYNYALPTKTITYSGSNGTGTIFESTSKYDFNTGVVRFLTDPNNKTTETDYDLMLRPIKIVAPTGHQTITEYGVPDTSGPTRGQYSPAQRFTKIKSQIDAVNWKESSSWFDGLGRIFLTQNKDSNGDVFKETEFDQMGRAKKVTNAYRAGETKQWTESFYDAAGRISKVKSPDNAEVETFYSLATTGAQIGRAVTVEDQTNRQKRSITNALGQLKRVDEPDDNNQLGPIDAPYQPTYYNYDALNNLIEVQQTGTTTGQCGGAAPNCAQTRTLQYDALSRLKQATNPESGTVSYVYDGNGNLTGKTDARGVSTVYAYDALNRIQTRTYSDGTTLPVSYTYDDPNITDSKGRLTKVTTGNPANAFSETRYVSFDAMGRVTGSQQMTDGVTYNPQTYVYNLSGALIEETYPSGRVVKNTLDTDGDLQQVQSRKANDTFRNYANSFSYTASGSVSAMRLGNGRWENTQFNSRLQPVQIGLGASATNQSLLKLNYDYGSTDNNGNVKSQTITVERSNQSPLVFNQTYTYDSLNRLKQVVEMTGTTQNWKQTYTFDRFGNRRFDTSNNNTTTLPPSFDPNIYNPTIDPTKNRFTTGQGYVYDSSGNITSDAEGRSFTYDAENKQKTVATVSADIGQYFYDGEGKRVKKITNTETVIFVYNANGKIVAEYSTQISQTPQTQYLTNDQLTTPRIITDGLGNVVSRSDYMPYGEEIVGLGNRSSADKYVANDVRQGFTGYEKDAESALDYAQARYYNPIHGRFTTSDPLYSESGRLQSPQALNLYVYTRNNPLKFVDPTGLEVKVTCTTTDEKKTQTCHEQTAADLNNRKDAQFKVEVKNGKLSVVGNVDVNKLSKSEKALYTAITDTKNVAELIVKMPGIGNEKLTFAQYNGVGVNTVDRADLNQLNKVDSRLSGEVMAHEIMEGYLGVAEKLGKYDDAHKRANEYFGNVDVTDVATLPKGAETATDLTATYNFQRVGVKVVVEKTLFSPQPASEIKNFAVPDGHLKVKPVVVNPPTPTNTTPKKPN